MILKVFINYYINHVVLKIDVYLFVVLFIVFIYGAMCPKIEKKQVFLLNAFFIFIFFFQKIYKKWFWGLCGIIDYI